MTEVCVYTHVHVYTGELVDLHKSNQDNTTNMNIPFSIENEKKKELLRWDSKPRHTAYKAYALPTELPRQLCWLGRIKALQGKGN